MKSPYLLIVTLLVSSICALGAGPAVWTVDTRAEVLKGDARGVSIDQDGLITLAPQVSEVFKTGEQYIWSSVVDADGTAYLGTGGSGKIYKVDAAGKGVLLAKLPEMNVSALALGPGGTVFAGTSPDGKVYQIERTGKFSAYFEPGEKYIWSLAVMSDGGLAVGTGDGGRIYRVTSANAQPQASKFFDSSEAHIISLRTDKQGDLIAGTAPGGVVLRFGRDGRPFALLDSPLNEIHDITIAPDGTIYVLAVGESASKPSESASPAVTETKPSTAPKPTPAVEPVRSRYDLTGARSAVYRILADGSSDVIWSSHSVTAFSIAVNSTGNGVLVGTSDKGRVYEVTNDAREKLLLQTDADQISTLRPFGGGFLATSSNQGDLYRIGPGRLTQGSYESTILDARSTATWGRIWWNAAGIVKVQTRTGNTELPDETWSAWSTAEGDSTGVQITSPKARYLQWRANLSGNGTAASSVSLGDVNVAYAPRNIAPEVLTVQVLPTNVGLASNPPAQIDPNIALSGMEPSAFGIVTVVPPPRKVFERGATSLMWTAEDRNGDSLVYDVFYKAVGETAFRPLRTGLAENYVSIDGQSLSDGEYIFEVIARDTPSNPTGLALSGEKTIGPVSIDNTPPTVTITRAAEVVGDRLHLSFDAVDSASYITRAEYSLNGGSWQPIDPIDGIADSPRESFVVDIPAAAGENAITVKAFDVNGNSGTARSSVRR